MASSSHVITAHTLIQLSVVETIVIFISCYFICHIIKSSQIQVSHDPGHVYGQAGTAVSVVRYCPNVSIIGLPYTFQ